MTTIGGLVTGAFMALQPALAADLCSDALLLTSALEAVDALAVPIQPSQNSDIIIVVTKYIDHDQKSVESNYDFSVQYSLYAWPYEPVINDEVQALLDRASSKVPTLTAPPVACAFSTPGRAIPSLYNIDERGVITGRVPEEQIYSKAFFAASTKADETPSADDNSTENTTADAPIVLPDGYETLNREDFIFHRP